MIDVNCRSDRVYSFDPQHTALIVIDMQRDFLGPGGMLDVQGDDIEAMRTIIPGVEAVLARARHFGMTIVHTREGYAPDLSDVSPLKRNQSSVGTEGPLGRFLVRGERGHDFIDELQPHPEEVVVDKPGFGAFFRTKLEETLTSRKVTHLVICGVTTQCCVQSTLREAVDRGFFCLTLADCCAAVDPELHEATLMTIQGEGHLFGWISDSSDLLGVL